MMAPYHIIIINSHILVDIGDWGQMRYVVKLQKGVSFANATQKSGNCSQAIPSCVCKYCQGVKMFALADMEKNSENTISANLHQHLHSHIPNSSVFHKHRTIIILSVCCSLVSNLKNAPYFVAMRFVDDL